METRRARQVGKRAARARRADVAEKEMISDFTTQAEARESALFCAGQRCVTWGDRSCCCTAGEFAIESGSAYGRSYPSFPAPPRLTRSSNAGAAETRGYQEKDRPGAEGTNVSLRPGLPVVRGIRSSHPRRDCLLVHVRPRYLPGESCEPRRRGRAAPVAARP